jgi:hypothetical protein
MRHQRYCSKPVCRKESKAQSQRRWQQSPENQNYFRGPENRQRVKDWRKANPGYWRKKKSSTQVPLQDLFQAQVAHDEELTPRVTSDALQDLFSIQPAVVVGLISMMTGSALQEDIASTVGVLVRKGRDILDMKPGSQTTRPYRWKPNDFFVRNDCELCRISLVGSINVWCARVTSPAVAEPKP